VSASVLQLCKFYQLGTIALNNHHTPAPAAASSTFGLRRDVLSALVALLSDPRPKSRRNLSRQIHIKVPFLENKSLLYGINGASD
jgi:hypothetical protein